MGEDDRDDEWKRRALAAEAEKARLEAVIRTGGAMYRAERAAMGIPGGIDDEKRVVDWGAMTAEEIAALVESAPVVLRAWHPHGEYQWVRRGRLGRADAVFDGKVHRWTLLEDGDWVDGGYADGGYVDAREAAMAAADDAARKRGWRLMGGE